MNRFIFTLVGFFLVSSVSSQVTIWLEDFSGYGNGVMNNNPTWTSSYTDIDDGSSINAGDNWWGVYNGEWRCNDIEGAGQNCLNYFTTQAFNIACYTNVSIEFDARFTGTLECGGGPSSNDEIKAEYSINGGPWIQFAFICGPTGLPNSFSVSGLSGNTLAIRFHMGNKSNDENYFIDNIEIKGFPPANANAGPNQSICNGQTVVLNGSGGGTYSWAPASGLSCPTCQSTTASPNVNTSYVLTVTNGTCVTTDTVLVTVANVPSVNLGPDASFCNTSINLGFNVAQPNSTYLWSNGVTNPQYVITAAGLYWVEVSNICGSARDTIVVFNGLAPAVQLGPDQNGCITGMNIPLNAGNPGTTYAWSTGSTNQSITVTQPGTYWVNVTNPCGTGSDTVVVTAVNPPLVNLGPDTILCNAAAYTLDASFPGATYSWNTGVTAPQLTVNTDGLYTVTVTNSCGNVSDNVQVTFVNTPAVNLGADKSLCGPQGVTLDAGPGMSSYTWSVPGNTQTISVNTPGTYWVEVQNACGTASDTVLVSLASVPVVNLGNDTILCGQGWILPLDATSNGNSTYSWNSGETTPQIQITAPGFYEVQVTNDCGSVSGAITVTQGYDPVEVLDDIFVDCSEDQVTLNAQNPNANFLWSTGATSQTIVVNTSGIYWVDISSCGNLLRDSVLVRMDTIGEIKVFVPNAFTNNLDQLNDTYQIGGTFEGLTSFSAEIFNRWGQRIYFTDNPYFQWDPDTLPAGTYVIKIQAEGTCNDRMIQLQEGIQLLR